MAGIYIIADDIIIAMVFLNSQDPMFCSISYESCVTHPIQDTNISLYNLNNFIFHTNEMKKVEPKKINKEIKILGDVFLFDIFGYQYYHMLYDKVGQFEALKKMVPGIRPLFFTNLTQSIESTLQFHLGAAPLRDIIKIYNIKQEDILYLSDYEKVIVDSCWYVTYYSNNGVVRQLPHNDNFVLGEDARNSPNGYVYQATMGLRDLIRPSVEYSSDYPKKIYISRSKAFSEVLNAKEFFETVDLDNMSTDEQKLFSHYVGTYGGSFEECQKILASRSMDMENNQKIEQMFIDLGYTVIFTEGMGVLEQAKYFLNATHIAAFKGTGLSNVAFVQKNAKIFIMNNNNIYDHYYKDISKFVADKVYEFPEQKVLNEEDLNRTYVYEDFKKYIDENLLDII